MIATFAPSQIWEEKNIYHKMFMKIYKKLLLMVVNVVTLLLKFRKKKEQTKNWIKPKYMFDFKLMQFLLGFQIMVHNINEGIDLFKWGRMS